MYYVLKWPVFRLQRGSAKSPIAPSNFSPLWSSLSQNSPINFPIWIIDRITIYNVVGIFQHACREVCMWMYYLTTNNVWKISNFLRVKRFVLKNTLPPLDLGIPHVSSKSATKIRHLFIGLLVRTGKSRFKKLHFSSSIESCLV